jgi:hypothetical protein
MSFYGVCRSLLIWTRRHAAPAVLLLLFLPLGLAATPGDIYVVAGGGALNPGDGGPATSAFFQNPTAVAVDSSGNIFVACDVDDRIREIDPATGIITTFAGNGIGGYAGDGGPATGAEIVGPHDLAFDAAGNLYIADSFNACVRMVAKGTNIITTVAGNGSMGFSGDGGLATSAQLRLAWAIAFDAAGNLYIADGDYGFSHSGASCVRKVTGNVAAGTGIISTIAGSGTYTPWGFSGDGGPATSAVFANLRGIAVDSTGNVFLSDWGNNRVREVFAASGNITTVAGAGGVYPASGGFGGDWGPAALADLSQPLKLAFDAAGNLFIADSRNARVRKVAVGSGVISTVAGNGIPTSPLIGAGGPATSAELFVPSGLWHDALGNLFMTDSGDQLVMEVDDLDACTPTSTPSRTLTQTQTLTPSPDSTPSPTPTATPSATPDSTPSPTFSKTATPGPPGTQSPSPRPGTHATASPTPTFTASPTPTPTQTPGSSPTPRPSTSSGPSGGGLRAFPVPQPNPTHLSVFLPKDSGRIAVTIYSRAMVRVWKGDYPQAFAAGWNSVNLPVLASSVYFAKVEADGSGTALLKLAYLH